ncbi:hypothetical protein H6G36_02805 [Anabaena minutissima FACHB-250]|nr:hypothetical protein [Anabaena minutissima FACHB-250]
MVDILHSKDFFFVKLLCYWLCWRGEAMRVEVNIDNKWVIDVYQLPMQKFI